MWMYMIDDIKERTGKTKMNIVKEAVDAYRKTLANNIQVEKSIDRH